MKHRLFDRPESGSDGMAMVLVVWLLGLIAALAAVAARLASAQDSGAVLALDRVHAEIAMTAALDAAGWQIVSRGPQGGRGSAAASVGSASVTITFENEMARIDINKAPEPLLEGMFVSVGAPKALAGRLAAAVVDWRDPDDETSPGGAEKLAYGPDRPPPRNGPFVDPAEIGRVLGVTPAIAAAVQPLITVVSGSDRIDPRIASRAVLLALPGATPLKLAAYSDAMRRGRPQAEALALLGDVEAYVGDSNSPVWRLLIDADSGGATTRYEASLFASSRKDAPYDILRFSEAAAAPPAAGSTGRGGKT